MVLGRLAADQGNEMGLDFARYLRVRARPWLVVRSRLQTTGEVLDFLIESYLDLAAQQRHFFAIFVSLLGHGGIPLLQELGFDTPEIGRRYHQHLSAVFRQAQATQPQSAMAPIDADLLPFLFFSFFNGLWLTYAEWEALPRAELHAGVLRLIGYACPAAG
jgi:hypothetical protein